MSTRQSSWPRSFSYCIVLYIVFNSIFLALVVIKPGTHAQFMIADDVGQALGWLLGTFFCFIGLNWPWRPLRSSADTASIHQKTLPWISILLALGIFCQFVGQIIYTYYDMRGWVDFPSWADAAYLSTFPFFLMGVMLLSTRPLSKITRSRVMLDGFVTMTALVTFSWYFILGPTMLQGNESVLAKLVGSAYPFFDLVLIFGVLRLSFRSNVPALQTTVRLLSLGLVMIVITDTIYDYQTLRGIYINGLQDVGWPIGYMLIGLAAQALNLVYKRQHLPAEATASGEASHEATIAVSSGWYSYLSYALVPVVILLAVSAWFMGADSNLARGVYWGASILVLLIVLRQFFALRETLYYNKELLLVQEELHRKNQELSGANEQLEAQTRQIAAAYEQQLHVNELKDQFLLNVNHELRTPLTAIHGYLELLQGYQEQIDADTQSTFINLAAQGCEELQHLVNNVLDAIQGDFQAKAPQFEMFSVLSVVHEVIDLFEPQKRREYQITLDVPEDLTIRADHQYLHQILLNLLSNAFKYSPKRTSVVIRAFLQHGTDAESKDSYVCICVQDAGLGVPPSDIPLLFEKFVRLKRDLVGSVRGTGLGLYICKQLVEAMQGRIWVESAGIAGQGSCFSFTVPSASQDQIAIEAQLEVSTMKLPPLQKKEQIALIHGHAHR